MDATEKIGQSDVLGIYFTNLLDCVQILQGRSLLFTQFLVDSLKGFCTCSLKQLALLHFITRGVHLDLVVILDLFDNRRRNLLTFRSSILVENVHLLLSVLRVVLFT